MKLKSNECIILPNPTYYRKLVGKLNFLTNNNMDIAYSVLVLSHLMKEPREPHLADVFHLLRDIKKQHTLRIFFSNDSDCTIRVYCDSD